MSDLIMSNSNPGWKQFDNLDLNWSNNSLTASHVIGSSIELNHHYTASLEMANPASSTLTSLLPGATTGSMYLVGSGSESWIVLKDIKGIWRTISASIAA